MSIRSRCCRVVAGAFVLSIFSASAPLRAGEAACPTVLDVNLDTAVDASGDGVIVLRYLFGFDGARLTDSALPPGAQRTDPADIAAHIAAMSSEIDVDGDGSARALTDGLLVMRYLAGMRGATLVANVIDAGATRAAAAQIEPFVAAISGADSDDDGIPDRCDTDIDPPGGDGYGIDRYDCASVVYVAPTGDNANAGSEASPVRTIDHALSRAMPGECVHVLAGTYTEEVRTNRGGTALAPILLYAARGTDGERLVHIDNSSLARNAISIFHPYIVVDGFRLTGYTMTTGFHAIDIQGGDTGIEGNNAIVRHCVVTGGHNQLKSGHTDDSLIEYNEFFGSFAHIPISVTSNQRTVFRGNVFRDYENGGNGAIQIKGGSRDVVFERNTLRNITGAGGALSLGDGCSTTCDRDPDHYAGVNLIARNNVFVNVNRALDVYGCRDCRFVHNTVITRGTTTPPVKLDDATTGGVTQRTEAADLRNNVFANIEGTLFSGRLLQVNDGAIGTLYDYNLVWNNGSIINASDIARGANNIQMLPAFVDAAADNYRLQPSSPGIDDAIDLGVTQDFDRAVRPQGAAPDIGAFETEPPP